jgi:hypothetical protein
MVCGISESSLVFLVAMATFRQSSPSKATMFGLTAEDQLEVVSNLPSRPLAGSTHLARSCKEKLLPIALESGVP